MGVFVREARRVNAHVYNVCVEAAAVQAEEELEARTEEKLPQEGETHPLQPTHIRRAERTEGARAPSEGVVLSNRRR